MRVVVYMRAALSFYQGFMVLIVRIYRGLEVFQRVLWAFRVSFLGLGFRAYRLFLEGLDSKDQVTCLKLTLPSQAQQG